MFFYIMSSMSIIHDHESRNSFLTIEFLQLFLFKNKKDLCQNNRCQEEQKVLNT